MIRLIVDRRTAHWWAERWRCARRSELLSGVPVGLYADRDLVRADRHLRFWLWLQRVLNR